MIFETIFFWSNIKFLFKQTVEIGNIGNPHFRSDFVNRFAGFGKQFCRHNQSVIIDKFYTGNTDVCFEITHKVMLAQIQKFRKPGNGDGGIVMGLNIVDYCFDITAGRCLQGLLIGICRAALA